MKFRIVDIALVIGLLPTLFSLSESRTTTTTTTTTTEKRKLRGSPVIHRRTTYHHHQHDDHAWQQQQQQQQQQPPPENLVDPHPHQSVRMRGTRHNGKTVEFTIDVETLQNIAKEQHEHHIRHPVLGNKNNNTRSDDESHDDEHDKTQTHHPGRLRTPIHEHHLDDQQNFRYSQELLQQNQHQHQQSQDHKNQNNEERERLH